MTFFHFGNCAALACVPYFMTYKFSGLSEYGSFWKCVQAGMIYLLTQLCKMLVLATFFPTFDHSGSSLDFISEFMKSTIDLADLLGLYFVMSKVAGKGEIKFLVAGLGWATAELLMTRFLPLWVGARGVEFDWKYIQMSFDSNISLVQHISTATLVWLWGRKDLHKSVLPIVMVLLIFNSFKPLIMELFYFWGPDPDNAPLMAFLSSISDACEPEPKAIPTTKGYASKVLMMAQMLIVSSWSLLLVKFGVTILVATIALQIYLGLAQTISSY